jgi:hypothetical protein
METVYWTMKDGKKISIDDMDINHLRNSLKMVVRGLERLKLQQKKSTPKFELKGDIAQDHYDMMMDNAYANDMDYHQGL